MIIKLSTKRDINGNRYYLGFDTEKKVYARTSAHWYCKEDVLQITKTERRRMIEQLKDEGYTEIDRI